MRESARDVEPIERPSELGLTFGDGPLWVEPTGAAWFGRLRGWVCSGFTYDRIIGSDLSVCRWELLSPRRHLIPKAGNTSMSVMKMDTPTAVEVRDSAKPAQGRLKISFWLSMTLLVSVCALPAVPFTGLFLHEWLGLAIVVMVFAHLLLSWSWISSLSRRFFAVQTLRARINYLLNLSLFAAITAVVYSGIVISQQAIPALAGTNPPDMDWRWHSIHSRFSLAVVMLSGFHLAINWEWVLAAAQKVFRRAPGKASV